MKKFFAPVLFCLIALLAWHHTTLSITMLTKNDPYPLYTTAYPYYYLLFGTINYLKDINACPHLDRFSFTITPFHQKANIGRDFDGQKAFLGDLEGKWNMLGMLYGPVPTGETLAGTELGRAKTIIFPGLGPNDLVPNDQVLTDTTGNVGFFSVPLKYRKSGVRFEISVQPIEDFGATFQFGFADIKQTLTNFIDLTQTVSLPDFIFPPLVVAQVEQLLMTATEAQLTFSQIGLETCDFESDSIEDLRFFVWWRHAYEINHCNSYWPRVFVIPFVQIEGTAPIAKVQDRTKAFALPFGNDGHASVGFSAGFHLDFKDTIEFGFFGGYTHFFPRTISRFRIPNHFTQSGVFPFSTQVRRSPGHNSIFGVLFHAYRFIDRLSFYAEYDAIHHTEDSIELVTPDSAFIPRQVECLSKWRVQVLNTALNYEVTPNITIGMAAQWPITQRNAYRSTSFLGSIIATF